MSKIYYIIALSIILTSCAKRVTNKLLSAEEVMNTEESLTTFSLDSFYTQKVNLRDFEFEFTKIDFSAPDSAGNQHPVSLTSGKISGRDSTNEKSTHKDEKAEVTHNTNKGVSTIHNSESKTTETKPYVPPWFCIMAVILVVIAGHYIIVWLKKHGYY